MNIPSEKQFKKKVFFDTVYRDNKKKRSKYNKSVFYNKKKSHYSFTFKSIDYLLNLLRIINFFHKNIYIEKEFACEIKELFPDQKLYFFKEEYLYYYNKKNPLSDGEYFGFKTKYIKIYDILSSYLYNVEKEFKKKSINFFYKFENIFEDYLNIRLTNLYFTHNKEKYCLKISINKSNNNLSFIMAKHSIDNHYIDFVSFVPVKSCFYEHNASKYALPPDYPQYQSLFDRGVIFRYEISYLNKTFTNKDKKKYKDIFCILFNINIFEDNETITKEKVIKLKDNPVNNFFKKTYFIYRDFYFSILESEDDYFWTYDDSEEEKLMAHARLIYTLINNNNCHNNKQYSIDKIYASDIIERTGKKHMIELYSQMIFIHTGFMWPKLFIEDNFNKTIDLIYSIYIDSINPIFKHIAQDIKQEKKAKYDFKFKDNSVESNVGLIFLYKQFFSTIMYSSRYERYYEHKRYRFKIDYANFNLYNNIFLNLVKNENVMYKNIKHILLFNFHLKNLLINLLIQLNNNNNSKAKDLYERMKDAENIIIGEREISDELYTEEEINIIKGEYSIKDIVANVLSIKEKNKIFLDFIFLKKEIIPILNLKDDGDDILTDLFY